MRYFKSPEHNITEKLAFFVRQGVATKGICDISSCQNAVLRKKGDYLSTLAPAPDTIFSTSLSEAIDVSPGVVIASAPCATP